MGWHYNQRTFNETGYFWVIEQLNIICTTKNTFSTRLNLGPKPFEKQKSSFTANKFFCNSQQNSFSSSAAINYSSLPMIRPRVKRTNSEPSSIALQVERSMHEQGRLNANRSHGDLNTVDHKSWSAGIRNEIPSQFMKGTSGAGGTSGDSCSTSSSTSSPPSSPLPGNSASASLSAQEELDQFPESHFSFKGQSVILF